MNRRFRGSGYKPPAVDGHKAKANAVMFLTNVRSLDGATAEALARNFRLRPETAAAMLADEMGRRGRVL